MRLRRLRRWWPVLPAALIILGIYAAWPGRFTFTVSPETTYITEPVDAKGYVDYPTALNRRLSDGGTPENNALVLIVQALGPRPEGRPLPPDYYRWLGIDPPPDDGEYLIGREKYFDTHLKDGPVEVPNGAAVGGNDEAPPLPADRKQEWSDRIGRATKSPWKADAEPDIADWLKRNEKPLALAIAASKRSHYFQPRVGKSDDAREARLIGSLLPHVQKCRELVNALSCRAMGRVAEDDYDGAWQDLLACQRLGRLVARGSLIENLVGIALVTIATNGETTLLGYGNHSSRQILAWLEDLRKLPPLPAFADYMDLSERFMTLDALQSIAAGGGEAIDSPAGKAPPERPFWDRLFTRNIDFDPAFRNANRAFDECVVAARLGDRAARKEQLARIERDVEQANRAARHAGITGRLAEGSADRGERIGNILIGLLLPATHKIQDAADRTEQTQINLQIAFALAAFRADQGKYPPRLDELVPKYLPKIPPDVFSGKPLIYRPSETGYLLYSVGVNGIDEDGRSTDDDPKGDDLRVRMPVTEPARK